MTFTALEIILWILLVISFSMYLNERDNHITINIEPTSSRTLYIDMGNIVMEYDWPLYYTEQIVWQYNRPDICQQYVWDNAYTNNYSIEACVVEV